MLLLSLQLREFRKHYNSNYYEREILEGLHQKRMTEKNENKNKNKNKNELEKIKIISN
jgi:hypothetical protein